MRYPWNNDRNDTRITRLDPHVVVNAADPYEAIDKLWRIRVARNERRRLEASCEKLVFLRKQASL